MNTEIKKDLTSNWFKMIQESICHSISDLENNNISFKSTSPISLRATNLIINAGTAI